MNFFLFISAVEKPIILLILLPYSNYWPGMVFESFSNLSFLQLSIFRFTTIDNKKEILIVI